jgi:dihydroorotase
MAALSRTRNTGTRTTLSAQSPPPQNQILSRFVLVYDQPIDEGDCTHVTARILTLFVALSSAAPAQTYDLVLASGHVIDPANRIDEIMDVAFSGDRIVSIQKNIARDRSKSRIEVPGLYVTPGLVDLHAHVYGNEGKLFPDDTALVTGTTTVVDAGGAGWRTFDDFKKTVIDKVQTRVLVFLNIVGRGMTGGEDNVEDMDPKAIANKIAEHPQLIVGIKTAHFRPPGWTSIDKAVEAGRLSNTPVIVDSHIFTRSGRTTR